MEDWKKLKDKKKIVVKIGTSSLTYPNGKLHIKRIQKLAEVLSKLQKTGKKVVLVSSGAIGVGANRLGMKKRPEELSVKQGLAAIGQAELIKIYQKFFDLFGQTVAQVLLTKDGIANEHTQINSRNTLNTLLEMGIIPIINENDTVAIEEILFGDNDTLSADVAVLIEAGLLVMLSDIDGVYNKNPKKHPGANLITKIERIDEELEKIAEGAGTSFATGGMATKIKAAKTCSAAGIDTVITSGEHPEILQDILEGQKRGTLFVARKISSVGEEER